MGWERRARGGLYYTRSRKIGGRVLREYVGVGPVAEWIAATDADERRQRAEAVARQKAADAQSAEIDDLVRIVDTAVEILARATLVTAGYHRHHRGEWRKRRVQ